MDLAIVHYHLIRGGVTQVVGNHLRSLAALGAEREVERAVVVEGGRRIGWSDEPRGMPLDVRTLEGLDYDEGGPPDVTLGPRLEAELQAAGCSTERTVVHMHNHALGKNVSLPAAVGHLARQGWALLLHVHDLVEDFRPANYRKLRESLGPDFESQLYPVGARVQYAVLNGRDRQLLAVAGTPEPHLLPNPVAAPPMTDDLQAARERVFGRWGWSPEQRLLLYPVRGIRRKNVGEALLWSAVLGRRAAVAVTLPPQSPAELASFNYWQSVAKSQDLSCHLGVGGPEGSQFADLVAACDGMLTTSVAEGFGMVFLESWLARRPLAGRDLPEITQDFVRQGVVFEHLRERLPVPLSWVGEDRFRQELLAAYRRACDDYARTPADGGTLDDMLDSLTAGGLVDFALLSPEAQASAIQQAAAEPAPLGESTRPWMERCLEFDALQPAAAHVEANAEVVERRFSLAASGARLQNLYAQVLAAEAGSEVRSAPRPQAILDTMLRIDRLHLVRLADFLQPPHP